MSKRKSEDKEDEQPPQKLAPLFTKGAGHASGKWKGIPGQTMIFSGDGLEGRSKVLGFDLDGTLIKTKSGNIFPKNEEDWQLWDQSIPAKIKKYYEDGYKICIFTNQKGIQIKKVQPGAFRLKIQQICSRIGVPMQVFVSVGTCNYRKPYVGMWTWMEEKDNDGVEVDRGNCLYVGDAAGRKASKSRKADHSCADRLFAMNLGVKFQTPEQFFLGQPHEEPFDLPEFDPSSVLQKADSNVYDPPAASVPHESSEIIVLVGSMASGKSSIAAQWANLHNYTIVSQDQLKTWQNCVKAADTSLRQGRSVVIDNTNRDRETRKRYVDLAKSLGVHCRCFVMQCSFPHAVHNNVFRQIVSPEDAKNKAISESVIRMFFANYKPPTADEGFDQIARINFVPAFNSEEDRKIYGMRLTEK